MEDPRAPRRAPLVTYEVSINGRTRRVEVEHADDGLVVLVDGQRHLADVTSVNGAISLILDQRSFEVAILEQPPASGNLTIHVNGRVVAASVGSSRGARVPGGHDAVASHGGPHTVTAPMPGKVVKVLVKPGDAVTTRQGVVVVEAMKMENELRSPKAGTVTQVTAAEGMSVEAGAALLVIE
jgi:biotin carboxyl carrier protein